MILYRLLVLLYLILLFAQNSYGFSRVSLDIPQMSITPYQLSDLDYSGIKVIVSANCQKRNVFTSATLPVGSVGCGDPFPLTVEAAMTKEGHFVVPAIKAKASSWFSSLSGFIDIEVRDKHDDNLHGEIIYFDTLTSNSLRQALSSIKLESRNLQPIPLILHWRVNGKLVDPDTLMYADLLSRTNERYDFSYIETTGNQGEPIYGIYGPPLYPLDPLYEVSLKLKAEAFHPIRSIIAYSIKPGTHDTEPTHAVVSGKYTKMLFCKARNSACGLIVKTYTRSYYLSDITSTLPAGQERIKLAHITLNIDLNAEFLSCLEQFRSSAQSVTSSLPSLCKLSTSGYESKMNEDM